jgi:hypothetical protein
MHGGWRHSYLLHFKRFLVMMCVMATVQIYILFTTQMAFHEYKTYVRFVVLTFMFIANYLLPGRDPIFAFEMGGKLARDGVTSPDSAPVSGEGGRLASVMCLRLAAGARLGRMKYTFSLGISLLRSRKRKSSFVVSIK